MVALVSPRRAHIHNSVVWLGNDAPGQQQRSHRKSMDAYLEEVEAAFTPSRDPRLLHSLSTQLQDELAQKLQSSSISMLPSYHHTLPSGAETGTFVALDVGGSNFRIALIELNGSHHKSEEEQTRVRHCLCFPIGPEIKALKGKAFFSWMADRIAETLASSDVAQSQEVLRMGLAWSFPIEQTSARSGHLLAMGKGFSAVIAVEGQDLGELIMEPCRKLGLNVRLSTIVNDSSATLLSQAYREQTTRMSIILGTGVNSSVYLPVSALSKGKLDGRPAEWYTAARHVVVNTELSMHGKNIWPKTRWDKKLNDEHTKPDFQPLEHFVGGRYLGEIARLILVEAIQQIGFLDGQLPVKLQQAYRLESSDLAAFEDATPSSLAAAGAHFSSRYEIGRSLTATELLFISKTVRLVSARAAALQAAAIHALWCLRNACEAQFLQESSASTCRLTNGERKVAEDLQLSEVNSQQVVIACNGSILEKYPGFRQACQEYLDQLVGLSRGGKEVDGRLIELRIARESSMFGAAIAAACCGDD